MVFTLFCSLIIWDTCMYTHLLRSCWFRLFWVATILQFCHLAKTIKLRLTEKRFFAWKRICIFLHTQTSVCHHVLVHGNIEVQVVIRFPFESNVLRVESLIHVPTRLNWTWSVEADMGQARVNDYSISCIVIPHL